MYKNVFERVNNPEALFEAWREFRRGKGNKEDVLLFEKDLEQHIFQLSRDLKKKAYRHGGYHNFFISDPKRRHIHKAVVRDRVVHHAIMSVLYPLFDTTFIANSFSCRIGKGVHKGVSTLRSMLRKESLNHTRACYVLKCDIQKFFDSIDHTALIAMLHKKIGDKDMLWLLEEVIHSYYSYRSDLFAKKGLPIGNLTSQLLANIYMNDFDQFVKHELKIKHYARYTDDFLIVSSDKSYLERLIPKLQKYLMDQLSLTIHPNKITITESHRGIDFLGYVVFPYHTLIRKRTARRAIRRLRDTSVQYEQQQVDKEKAQATLQSYLGILSHADAHTFSESLKNQYALFLDK